MFCSYCGQQIPDGSKFCPKCGHKLDVTDEYDNSSSSTSEQGADSSNQSFQKMRPGSSSTIQKKNSFNIKKLLPILIVCALAIVIIIVVAVNHKPTIDLSKYIKITFDGYDTVGNASYSFDSDQFRNDYSGKLKINKKALQDELTNAGSDAEDLLNLFGGSDSVSDYIENIDPISYLSYAFDGIVTPSDGLTNGDTVTFSWALTDDEIKELNNAFNCKFKADDVTATVEGLEEAETFDPFDGVQITYDGMAPNGRISNISRGNDPICQYLDYSANKDDGLSNGDTITITVDSYYADNLQSYLVENYGKIPSETSKEYTVSGLSRYISSASEIPDATLKQMQAEAEDAFNANVASNWNSDSAELVSLQYIGNYFLTAKSSDTYSNHNIIYLIYKVRAHVWYVNDNEDSYDNNIDYYWYCRFSDIILSDDNECAVDLTKYQTPSYDYVTFTVDSGVNSGWWSTKQWTFYGYEKVDMMYNQLVSVNIDKYKSENNVEDTSNDDESSTGDSSSDSATDESVETTDDTSVDAPTNSDGTYSDDQLASMASNYYLKSHNADFSHLKVEVNPGQSDYSVRIFVSEELPDQDASLAYYSIDTTTAQGTDGTGISVNLKENNPQINDISGISAVEDRYTGESGYSDYDITALVQAYYSQENTINNHVGTGILGSDSNDNNIANIVVFNDESPEDTPEILTSYQINRNTLTGTDADGNDVDLSTLLAK